MKKTTFIRTGRILFATLAMSLAAGANADTMTLNSVAQLGDGSYGSFGSFAANSFGNIRAGGSSTYGQVNYVAAFALPTLSAPIDTATLTLRYVSRSGAPAFNADVYGLSAGSAGALSLTIASFYTGPNDSSATMLADNFVTPTSLTASDYTVSGTALVGFLNSQYTGLTPNNTYAYFRISPDSIITSSSIGYNFSSETGVAPPTLEFTVVPEPSTCALLMAGFALASLCRAGKARAI